MAESALISIFLVMVMKRTAFDGSLGSGGMSSAGCTLEMFEMLEEWLMVERSRVSRWDDARRFAIQRLCCWLVWPQRTFCMLHWGGGADVGGAMTTACPAEARAATVANPASPAWQAGEVVLAVAISALPPAEASCGRGRGWKWVHLLSAHASLCLLLRARLLLLACFFLGWRGGGGGGAVTGAVGGISWEKDSFSIPPHASYSTHVGHRFGIVPKGGW
jgi:hypothetical protein